MKLSALAALVLLGSAAHAAPARPDIVVIDVCSIRADHLGAYGSGAGLTPGLDAFAAEAVTFRNFWAQSSWCLPNYATLLTGLRPEVHGLVADVPFRPLPKSLETFVQRLSSAGYRTGGFSSGVHALPVWGLDRGFETYENHYSTDEARAGRFADELPEIEAWLAKKDPRPFFLYATVDDLHTPYQTGAATVEIDTETVSVGFYRAYNGETPAPGSPLAAKLAAFREDPKALAAVRRRYDAALRAVDRSVSKLFADLKKNGQWKDTLVVLTGDHGELLGEQGLLGHTEGLYQGVLAVPAILKLPGAAKNAGARIDALAERLDLAPTILAAAGVDADGLEFQGRNLLPVIAAPSMDWRKVSYASSKRQLGPATDWNIDERAVRDDRWKLMWLGAQKSWRLYDLKNDPSETTDLANAHPEIVARLALAMLAKVEKARTHRAGLPSGRDDER